VKSLGWTVAVGSLFACSTPTAAVPAIASVAAQYVVESDEQAHRVGELAARHDLTVLVFYSATCPTVTAHDERLKQLWRDYTARGVGFYLVASEVTVSRTGLMEAAATHRYPFPLVWDAGAGVARDLSVRYASQAFVLTKDASIAYAGSIDSDRRFLHDDAKPYLRDALDALLSGSTPMPADAAAYGCALSL
jgi:peroxiredoxin